MVTLTSLVLALGLCRDVKFLHIFFTITSLERQFPRVLDSFYHISSMPMSYFGNILIFFGVTLVLLGIIFSLGANIPFLGRLPGDIYIDREKFTLYFPLATSILLSIILSMILSLFRK